VSARIDAFRQRLRELGYVEGKNIVIESRYAEGKLERLPNFAAEPVSLNSQFVLDGGLMSISGGMKRVAGLLAIVVSPAAWGDVASAQQPKSSRPSSSL
jgi:putative ABC transport system substrate-binding protein